MNLRRLDDALMEWMNRYAMLLLRVSLGIIFIWFGALKIVGLSPAAALVAATVYWLDPSFFVPFLGWWEALIGVCFLIRPLNRAGVLLMIFQMGGTFLTLVVLPQVCFKSFPFVLNIEGEFIIKNLVLLSAGLAVAGSEKLPGQAKGKMKL